jgi:hypothetical protein
MIVAVLVHFAVIAFWPNLDGLGHGVHHGRDRGIELPPEIEIPPPPEQISGRRTPW